VLVWARVAALSFGGPAGQIATMHRMLVEERGWIGEARFLHALSFCTLLPGPEAQQLATYIGWLMHRTRGGLAAGILFVLPGMVSIMGLSLVYAAWGQAAPVAALFFGLKCAVLAIVLQAVQRIGARALNNPADKAIAVAAFLAIFVAGVPFPLIVLAAGLTGWLGAMSGASAFKRGAAMDPASAIATSIDDDAPPAKILATAALWLGIWLAPVLAVLVLAGTSGVFSQIALFFSKTAVVGFGGAYAVLAYVAQQAVDHYHWLRPGEMLDGLGLAETTPGPLIMVTQFVGFLAAYRHPGALPPWLAGMLGGLITTWVTFAPCFLWVFAGAPFVESLRGNKALTGALAAITAAVVGVILNLALWFAVHTWFAGGTPNVGAIALSCAAMVAIFRYKVGMIMTLASCASLALVIHLLS
jgi:chromate transporter